MGRTTDVSNDSGGLPYPVSMLSGILPSNWRRYTVPTGLTVLQWVADFSDRVKQLQKISHAANTGGANAMAITTSVGTRSRAERLAMKNLTFEANHTAFVLHGG